MHTPSTLFNKNDIYEALFIRDNNKTYIKCTKVYITNTINRIFLLLINKIFFNRNIKRISYPWILTKNKLIFRTTRY
jgi:hypothetical protein